MPDSDPNPCDLRLKIGGICHGGISLYVMAAYTPMSQRHIYNNNTTITAIPFIKEMLLSQGSRGFNLKKTDAKNTDFEASVEPVFF